MSLKYMKLFKKNIVLIVLTIIAIYQCTEQLLDYLKYKTVVKVNVQMPYYSEIPAVSLCTQPFQGISIDFMKNIYPKLKNELQVLYNLNLSAMDRKTTIKKLYNKYIETSFRSLSPRKLFDMSIPGYIECLFYPNAIYTDPLKFNYKVMYCNNVSKILETLNNDLSKCFTINSRIGAHDWDHKQIRAPVVPLVNLGTIRVKYKEFLPHFIGNNLKFIVHNLYEEPNAKSDQALNLKFVSFKYFIVFNKFTIRRLESPYDTNCRYYNTIEDIKSNILSQKLCVKKCDALDGTYKSLNSIEFEILRKSNKTIKFVNGSKGLHNQKCIKICKTNCLDHYWEFDLLTSDTIKVNYSSAYYFNFKIKPGVEYIHKPKTELIDFICQIAGIINLWFGVSVINLNFFINHLMKTFRKHNFMITLKKFMNNLLLISCFIFCFYHLHKIFHNYYEKVNVKTSVTICSKDMNFEVKNISSFVECKVFSKVTRKLMYCSPNEALKIVRYAYPRNNCSTFFSWHQSNDSLINDLNTESIFKIDFNVVNKEVMFTIHSAYDLSTLHNISSYISIQRGVIYNVIYETITQRDESNCFDYVQNWDTREKPKSRFDCMRKCISYEYSILNCYLESPFGMKTSDFIEIPVISPKFCANKSIISQNIRRIYNYCQNNCKADCFNIFYNFKYNERKTRQKTHQNNAIVYIGAKNAIYHNYRNKYQIDIWEFISNIGNIFGLWLGWSIISIANIKVVNINV
jgi:hypothetical protein